mmetsp:Transcript_120777/g.352778  ORF Transcript_120777/g.352778 Transcript_120777/m.352778 type:complete len:247 (+) Transcript_120777:794-1534(+)
MRQWKTFTQKHHRSCSLKLLKFTHLRAQLLAVSSATAASEPLCTARASRSSSAESGSAGAVCPLSQGSALLITIRFVGHLNKGSSQGAGGRYIWTAAFCCTVFAATAAFCCTEVAASTAFCCTELAVSSARVLPGTMAAKLAKPAALRRTKAQRSCKGAEARNAPASVAGAPAGSAEEAPDAEPSITHFCRHCSTTLWCIESLATRTKPFCGVRSVTAFASAMLVTPRSKCFSSTETSSDLRRSGT